MEVYNSMGQRGGTKSSGARSQKQWEGMVRDRGVRSQGGKDHKAEELGLYSAAAGKHWKGAIWSNSPLTLNWVSILRPQDRQSFISLQRGVQASPELTKQQQLAHDRLLTKGILSLPRPLLLFDSSTSFSHKPFNVWVKEDTDNGGDKDNVWKVPSTGDADTQ